MTAIKMSVDFYSKPYYKTDLGFFRGQLGGGLTNNRFAIRVENPPKPPLIEMPEKTVEKHEEKVVKHKRSKIDDFLGKYTY